jgi:tRNA(adenine34) deaminase
MGVENFQPQSLVGLTSPESLSESEQDVFWMRLALRLADYAEGLGEVPVGALIVRQQVCIAVGYNRSIIDHDPTAHAEMMALKAAGIASRNYRLPLTTLYVTLEPCAMCANAMVHARVSRLVYGAADSKTGAAGSVFNLAHSACLNHQLDVVTGVLGDECSMALSSFFQKRRAEKKRLKKEVALPSEE